MNYLLSLVLCTVDREREAEDFLESLYPGSQSLELIIVDQNQSSYKWEEFIESKKLVLGRLVILKEPKKSLSHARNIGIQEITGKYVGFPDDDCTYSRGMLNQLMSRIYQIDRDSQQYCGFAISYPGCSLVKSDKVITSEKLLGGVISFSFFLRSFFLKEYGIKFSTKLGVGTFFGAGEETELLLNVLNEQNILLYDESIYVYHPEKKNLSFLRSFQYGLGHGAIAVHYFLKPKLRHIYPTLKLIFGPLWTILCEIKSMSAVGIAHGIATLSGRWLGFFLYVLNLLILK